MHKFVHHVGHLPRTRQHVSSCYHMLLQVCGNNLNIISMCAVSPVVHTSNISSGRKKLFQFSYGCEQFHYGRFFGFLVISVCNHGEHYETPCIVRECNVFCLLLIILYLHFLLPTADVDELETFSLSTALIIIKNIV